MDTTTTVQTTSLPAFPSSANAQKASATITGILTGLSGIIMLVATVYHFPLTANTLNNFIQEFAAATSAVITAGGMAYTVFGLLRKAAVALFAKKPIPTAIVTSTVSSTIPTV